MREMIVSHFLRQNGRGTELLLGERKSLFKGSVWNGPGGKLWKNEGIVSGGGRENFEEIRTKVDPRSVQHFATLEDWYFGPSGHYLKYRIYFLNVTKWIGEPQLTGCFWNLKWFSVNDLPYSQMMVDRREWLPLALENKDPNKLLHKFTNI